MYSLRHQLRAHIRSQISLRNIKFDAKMLSMANIKIFSDYREVDL